MTKHTFDSLIDPVRDWYDGDGRHTDAASMIAEAIKDLQRDRMAILHLRQKVISLVDSIDGVQDWSDTRVGECLDNVRDALDEWGS